MENPDGAVWSPSAVAEANGDATVPGNPATSDSTTLDDAILSPTHSTAPAVPPKPISQMSSAAPTPNLTQSSTPVPAQSKPRIVGGFEVDDDDDDDDEDEDEDENDVEDDADADADVIIDAAEAGAHGGNDEFAVHVDVEDDADADVYDPAAGLDFDTPPPAPSVPLDRSSQSPEQSNGNTPAPVQAAGHTGRPADLPSLAVPTSADAPRTATATPVTPAQPVSNLPLQHSPPRAQVNGAAAAALPKARLAHDVVGILEDRIKDDPRGDSAAYLELIDEFKARNKQDDVRRVYEQYLKVFPFDALEWCSFVRWEEEHDRKFHMEKIFNQSLLQVLDVKLWSMYISYIRRRNSLQSGDVSRAYGIINSSFEFALKTVGMDTESGPVWQDYINFLKSGPGVVGGSTWQDGQKVDTLRAAYQRAIAVPTAATTALWKEYDSFETGLSKINGRKYLQEKSPAYMTARTAYTQLQNLTKDLVRTTRPRLPPVPGYGGYDEYMHQVELWKQWINWERDDNLVLKDEDVKLYQDRVVFAYKQALMALQFWPEIWYDAVDFCLANSIKDDQGNEVGPKLLAQGIESNPESPLLAFKLADRTEASTQNDEASDPGAKSRMEKIRKPYDDLLKQLYDLATKLELKMKEDVQKVEFAAQSNDGINGAGDDDEINAANVAAKKAALDAQIEAVEKAAKVQVDLLSRLISHVWIALMRVTRRVQGKGMPGERGPSGFRAILGEARKRGRLVSDFYVESAQIEWRCYRDPAGTKILERGLKLFPEDDYISLQYIKHLFDINDVTNARAVFETTAKRLLAYEKPEKTAKAKPLFAFLHDYESKYGELNQVQNLEERMRRYFPEDPLLKLFSSRYNTTVFDTMDFRPILSPTQVQPKSMVIPSVEVAAEPVATHSPIQKVIDSITTNSPKRPLPDDFDDIGPRKLARAESPLKGAAGRRMNQQQRQTNLSQFAAPPPPPLPPQIHYLLSILPKASTYTDVRFDPAKIVELIRDVHLPPPGSLPQHQSSIAPPQQASQAWPPYSAHPPPMPPQGFVPPPGTSQALYPGAPFRFA